MALGWNWKVAGGVVAVLAIAAWIISRSNGAPSLVLENAVGVGGGSHGRRGESGFSLSRTRLLSVDLASGAARERDWDFGGGALHCRANPADTLTCEKKFTIDAATLEDRPGTGSGKREFLDEERCGTHKIVSLGGATLRINDDMVECQQAQIVGDALVVVVVGLGAEPPAAGTPIAD